MSIISVIVPVYKVEPYLHRCVDSILSQTFTDFDLILVDDGSPDNCGKICDEYARKDNRIYVIHQENGGLSAARNTGIDWAFKNSDSEWLSFVDSDDWINSQYLAKLYQAITDVNINVQVSVCKFRRVGMIEEDIVSYPLMETTTSIESYESYLCEKKEGINPVTAWGKLFNKNLLEDIRFPVGKIHEDLFVVPQIQFKSANIVVVNQELYYYFYSVTSITGSQWNEKRLDEIAASEQLIRFLDLEGQKRAKTWAVKRCLGVINDQIDLIEGSPDIDYKALRFLKRKRKETLIRYSKELPIKNNSENRYRFEQAFPLISWFYWTSVGVFGKIKRVAKRDAKH